MRKVFTAMAEESLATAYRQLAGTPLFRGIDLDAFRQLAECWHLQFRTYEPKELIIGPQTQPNLLALLIEGRAHMLYEDSSGGRIIVKVTDKPGEVLGVSRITHPADEADGHPEDSTPHRCSVIAMQRCSALLLDYGKMLAPCDRACWFHTRMLINIARATSAGHVELFEHLMHISKHTIRERVLSYLSAESQCANNGEFTIQMNRGELADYLCVDRSALSTTLGKLRDEGAIEFEGNRFKMSGQLSQQRK